MTTNVIPIDLNFLGRKSAISAFLVPHSGGAALVETGPGSTLPALEDLLSRHGFTPQDITHVFLTHIHLDHAGASGWLAGQGAHIFVHPAGAAHLLNPEKLIASARRIYQDRMDELWGQFLPVPESHLVSVDDGVSITVGSLQFTAMHTPGHADHHIAWLLDDLCFSGDVGGVRLPGPLYLRMPFVPPELDFEKWRVSLQRLRDCSAKRIAPTHFGIFDDLPAHIDLAVRLLDDAEAWMEKVMPSDPPIETLRDQFVEHCRRQALDLRLDQDTQSLYEIANPTWMGADGIARYWRKHRMVG